VAIKKRYQKAPRITEWDNSTMFALNAIKNIEKIKGEKIPDDLRKLMLEFNKK
jgi:hypothetical protein